LDNKLETSWRRSKDAASRIISISIIRLHLCTVCCSTIQGISEMPGHDASSIWVNFELLNMAPYKRIGETENAHVSGEKRTLSEVSQLAISASVASPVSGETHRTHTRLDLLYTKEHRV
jgi:hypothetical protein